VTARAGGRVVGLDVARCVALVAMIATHMLVATDSDGDWPCGTPGLLSDPSTSAFLTHVAIVLAAGSVYRLAGQSGPLERSVTWAARRAAQAVG
jgi:uncharacterized membrane protein